MQYHYETEEEQRCMEQEGAMSAAFRVLFIIAAVAAIAAFAMEAAQ